MRTLRKHPVENISSRQNVTGENNKKRKDLKIIMPAQNELGFAEVQAQRLISCLRSTCSGNNFYTDALIFIPKSCTNLSFACFKNYFQGKKPTPAKNISRQ